MYRKILAWEGMRILSLDATSRAQVRTWSHYWTDIQALDVAAWACHLQIECLSFPAA